MKKVFLILLSTVIFLSFGNTTLHAQESTKVTFSDIDNHWANKDILEAVDRGIVNGFPDGTFRPDDIVTGDQLIVMLFKAYSHIENFADGPQGRFNDDFLKYLNKEYPGRLGSIQNALIKDEFDFNIAKKGYWAKPFIDFAYDMGYLHSYDSVYPQQYELFTKSIDREHASYLLGSWFETSETTYEGPYRRLATNKEAIKDLNDFSQGQVSSFIGTMMLSGIMRGYPNGNFYPKRYVTRAEATTMILRLVVPERRTPYKPDLTKMYYIDLNGIHLVDDKTKYDAYQTSIELAKKYLKTGYAEVGDAGVGIYASKEEADTVRRNMQTGIYDSDLSAESGFQIGEYGNKYVTLMFNERVPLIYSQSFVDAMMDFMAGSGNEQALRDKVKELEKLHPDNQVQTFSINGRNYRSAYSGKMYTLQYWY